MPRLITENEFAEAFFSAFGDNNEELARLSPIESGYCAPDTGHGIIKMARFIGDLPAADWYIEYSDWDVWQAFTGLHARVRKSAGLGHLSTDHRNELVLHNDGDYLPCLVAAILLASDDAFLICPKLRFGVHCSHDEFLIPYPQNVGVGADFVELLSDLGLGRFGASDARSS
jgi:hypothetical protein